MAEAVKLRGLSTLIAMALRERGASCAWEWVQGRIDDGYVVVGVDDGLPFALALDSGVGVTPDQVKFLQRWKQAGARVGVVATIRDALTVLASGRVDADAI